MMRCEQEVHYYCYHSLERDLSGKRAGRETGVDGVGFSASLAKCPEVPWVGLHQQAPPPQLPLQVQGVAQLLSVVGACLQEEPSALRGDIQRWESHEECLLHTSLNILLII